MDKSKKNILWFEEITINDTLLVGGKNASLGEMYSNLTKKGVNIPNGFALTATAFWYYLEKNNLKDKIKTLFEEADLNNLKDLKKVGKKSRNLILKGKFPSDLKEEIIDAYSKLSKKYGEDKTDVAVRSSGTAEDMPSISGDDPALVRIGNQVEYEKMDDLYRKFGDLKDKLQVPAMEEEGVKWRTVKNIYRHKAKGKLYKIRTSTGREITVSPDHSLIVLDKDNLVPKITSIKELSGNEKVPITDEIEALEFDRDYIKVLDYLTGEDVTVHNQKVKIKNNSDNWTVQNGLQKKILIDKEFTYFLGVYAAEGSTYSRDNCVIITNSNKEIMDRVQGFLKKIKLYKGQKLNKNSLRVYCKGLVRFLHSTCGKPLDKKGKGKGTQVKKVPNFVFGFNQELIGEFLKGYFDGDGGVVRKKNISVSSTSRNLIGGVAILLEMLQIKFVLRHRPKYNKIALRIYPSEAQRFKKMVGFEHPKKMQKLNKLIKIEDSKSYHPHFRNIIDMTGKAAQKVKQKIDDKIEKQGVEIPLCPLCKRKIKYNGYWEGRKKYYCGDCGKIFYKEEIDIKKGKEYVSYDDEGKFKKGSTPWNKGFMHGRYSLKELRKRLKEYGVDDFPYILNVKWDKIDKIKPVKSTDWVYDFEVPEVENFAAGFGGIITHNTASFAGQFETFLNVSGEKDLLKNIKRCMASLFNDRAIAYKEEKGFSHLNIALSSTVQKMIRSDLSSSGIMFSIDTETGFKDAVLINSIWGIGEMIVKGQITPDTFYVFKPMLEKGYDSIIRKDLGRKEKKLVYNKRGGLKEEKVSKEKKLIFSLDDNEILKLAKWAILIEKYYSEKNGKWMPQDMEWAKDGKTGELFIVQARPETVHAKENQNILKEYKLDTKEEPIIEGIAIGDKIGNGKAHVIPNVSGISSFKEGEVLVTKMTDPDWVPIMRKAAAIITNEGSKSCHAAIISRELGIPTIVGSENATKKIKTGQEITVDCTQGLEGRVFKGNVPFEVKEYKLDQIPKVDAKIMVNIGAPEIAFKSSFLPQDGVGLAREEFIIAEKIRVHPLALYHFDKLEEMGATKKTIEKIKKITVENKNKKDFFIKELSEGIAQIAAAFYPKPVIVRFSDFKTNEYKNLVGGDLFEGKESNPMLGFRGACRYLDEKFQPAFEMECQAIKRCREKFGLENISVMVPFCRTVEEGKSVIKIMEKAGLKRNNLKVYVMCEIPSNVILADEFLKVFDGMSIGTNDLTQLSLGMDRDNAKIVNITDERDLTIKKMVTKVIELCNKNNKYNGICGEAPSTYPDFAKFLIEKNINSISLNPNVVIKTILKISGEMKNL